jgi:peptidoglycan-N-acetylglucosamine deacetylase
MGYGDAGRRGGAGQDGLAWSEYWGTAAGRAASEQGWAGPQGTRPLPYPAPGDPGARSDAGRGNRMPRRMLLAALGGLLITGTTAAMAAAMESERSSAGAGRRSRAATETTAPRGAGGTASRPDRARPRGGETPPKPVYYIDDGPMTVALTIDDGPSPVYTPQILRILEERGVTASFSMVGQNVASYPGIAREVASAGHAIGNHTWSHPDMAVLAPAAMQDEIARATDAVHAATGQRPTLFRAPYGAWSPLLLEYCAAHGLTPLDWSVDPRDWARPGVTAIVANILRTTRAGSVILEHDGGGDRSQTVAALKAVVPRLLDEGFRFRLP